MLLKLKDLIISTDHIVKATYASSSLTNATLTIYMVDTGVDEKPGYMPIQHNIVVLTGFDAQLMWSYLSQNATQVVAAPPSAIRKPQG